MELLSEKEQKEVDYCWISHNLLTKEEEKLELDDIIDDIDLKKFLAIAEYLDKHEDFRYTKNNFKNNASINCVGSIIYSELGLAILTSLANLYGYDLSDYTKITSIAIVIVIPLISYLKHHKALKRIDESFNKEMHDFVGGVAKDVINDDYIKDVTADKIKDLEISIEKERNKVLTLRKKLH